MGLPPLKKDRFAPRITQSLLGSEEILSDVSDSLGFHAHVFKKDKATQKSKGIDIVLMKDMLVPAFPRNYDVAVLIAGDGDYVPLAQGVKRLGKWVFL